MDLRKNGFKKIDDEENTWLPSGTYIAKKDKLLVYYANPQESIFAVGIENDEDSLELKEFDTIDQLLSSFKKAKLVF